ncbi:MAG: response regulator [Candidatus Riflebacteria bacterium]|nr:response regulator [Candidatus Riflebacteria bacterium]
MTSVDPDPKRPSSDPRRLLVVDDDEETALLLTIGLRKGGFAVEVAVNGLDALRKLTQTTYDAVLLDLMIPGLDGLALLRQLRVERRSALPVVVCSSFIDQGHRDEAMAAGASAYVIKPVRFAVLLETLEKLGVTPASSR